MNQREMNELLNVPDRTLRDWKKGNRPELYKLLETLDYEVAQKLLNCHDNNDLKRLLENETYYTSLRSFEKDLYEVLVSGRDSNAWLKLSKDNSLSIEARARAAYLYSFLTKKRVKLSFDKRVNTGLYHGNKYTNGDGLASMYGLINGLDMARFNQFKMTGRF